MPDHPVLNIQCQSRDEIKTALTLLYNWTIAQRTKEPTLTGQYLGNLIVAGLSGLAAEWWRHLPGNIRNDLLLENDADQQILKALSKQFYGEDHADETDHFLHSL